ncbi:hypothetical protein [Nostoc sp. JL33]|uniref:hypothetical protein n=1 Tax=Nostoc sp. JL33 TaxID=2815396 RepID=UPI0025F598F4|nr:hypothetical protein [Nostoc sp. JL33]MBN3873351.1 hypothetical protein [Nostoc sp. JL33]
MTDYRALFHLVKIPCITVRVITGIDSHYPPLRWGLSTQCIPKYPSRCISTLLRDIHKRSQFRTFSALLEFILKFSNAG